MAGIAYVEIRLWNVPKFGDSEDILKLRRQTHNDLVREPTFTIRWIGTTQAGTEELGTAPTAAKDGTTTPYQVVMVSSSASDNDIAAGHVRKCALIGISTESIAAYNAWISNPKSPLGKRGKPILSVEVMAMNGTSDVTSSRFYIRIIHGYAIQWGSGDDDAAGNITFEAPANTALLTLIAGKNETGGCTLWFPPDLDVLVERGTALLTDPALIGVGDGVLFTCAEADFENGTTPDFPNTYLVALSSAPVEVTEAWWQHPRNTGSSTTKLASLVFSEILVASGGLVELQAMIHVQRFLN